MPSATSQHPRKIKKNLNCRVSATLPSQSPFVFSFYCNIFFFKMRTLIPSILLFHSTAGAFNTSHPALLRGIIATTTTPTATSLNLKPKGSEAELLHQAAQECYSSLYYSSRNGETNESDIDECLVMEDAAVNGVREGDGNRLGALVAKWWPVNSKVGPAASAFLGGMKKFRKIP